MAYDARGLADELRGKGIRDERVLDAIASTSRELFVPSDLSDSAYLDQPLPIGHGQTISQPFIVALMSEALELHGDERVLEIGTGSGFQTAILAHLCERVFSIEVVEALHARAKEILITRLGLKNVVLRWGEGSKGWSDEAPFDAILVTAAPTLVPARLIIQLRAGGRMVAPVGPSLDLQKLFVITRGNNGVDTVEELISVRFVPMVDSGGQPV